MHLFLEKRYFEIEISRPDRIFITSYLHVYVNALW